MASIVVKSYLEMPDESVQTRRFTLEGPKADPTGIFDVVQKKIGSAFPDLQGKSFTLYWKDVDEDFVTLSTDLEMQDAISNADSEICKIYVRADEDNSIEITQENEWTEEGEDQQGEKGNHQREDPRQIRHPPPFPLHHHHPPAPFGFHHGGPPPFGFHHGGPRPMGRHHGGPGWQFRGMGGFFHGYPGHHHGKGFKHHGCRGWEERQSQEKGSCTSPGRRSHSPGGRRSHSPGERRSHCHGGRRSRSRSPGHSHHGPRNGGHFPGHWGKHHGHHGWKSELRTLVPMPHRRWAKSFIHNWRSQNIENATSTSDSDFNSDGKITLANAGIPQAYADWLERKLACWHAKWASKQGNQFDQQKGKKALKESVPVEFRKWIKQYLFSHFGRRDAPRFRKDYPMRRGHCGKKDKFMKKRFANAQIPKEYEAWTKKFIQTWRIEKKLDEEGFELEPDTDGVVASIPEVYQQWLEIFLPRWHTRQGQLEKTPGQPLKSGQGFFKDKIAFDYRAWVKHYLWKNYTVVEEEEPIEARFDKMLLAFKNKWFQDQMQSDEDSDNFIVLSSSDEDNPTDQGEPETSFQRLNLTNNEDANVQNRKVHFNSEIQEKDKNTMDSDQEQGDNFPMNIEFRHWAKEALSKWDGQTINRGDNDGDDLYISPNIYRWMSKVMMKTQMKKMKKQFKAAKRQNKKK